MFDKTKSTDKAVKLIAEAAEQGAELIVFPELFIAGYPYGMTYGFTVGSRNEEGRKDWKEIMLIRIAPDKTLRAGRLQLPVYVQQLALRGKHDI